MVSNNVKGLLGKLLLGVALVGSPVSTNANDRQNVSFSFYDTSGSSLGSTINLMAHNLATTDGFDSGIDVVATTSAPPVGATISPYTAIPGKYLNKDWRSNTSTVPFNGNLRFLSATPLTNFNGRYEVKFNFKNPTNSTMDIIESNMFYWARFDLPVQFSSNSVAQTDKKAILSNMDTNRDTYFYINGVQVPYTNSLDFSSFEVNRGWNKLNFPTNLTNGAVSATNVNGAVTNGQVFTYSPTNKVTAKIDANSGYGLKSFDLIRQDISSGDISTNNIVFTNSPTSYSTNLESVVGENAIANVNFTNLPIQIYTATINPGVFEVTPTNAFIQDGQYFTATVANVIVPNPTNSGQRTKFKRFDKQ